MLRAFARSLGIDLSRANVGFIHMKGVRNFGHFAAEGTLEVLGRRRIKVWFVVDRDESSDAELTAMVARLNGLGELFALSRRELENYLLDAQALQRLISEKSRGFASAPSYSDIDAAIRETAASLKDEVIRLRLERMILRPLFLHTRETGGAIEDRLRSGMEMMAERMNAVEETRRRVEEEVNAQWPGEALALAPGTLVLERVLARYGMTYSKGSGDSAKLATHITTDKIPRDLQQILKRLDPRS